MFVSKIQCCKCGNVLTLHTSKKESIGCDGHFKFLFSYETENGDKNGNKNKSKL